MFYTQLTTKIEETLEKVDAVNVIYPYPLKEGEKISSYPAVIFFPDSIENSFETNGDNAKVYRYKMYLIVGGSTQEKLWTKILPNVVDKVIQQFDEDWDYSLIGSSRVWALIDSGQWTSALTDKGVEAIAELNLRIRLLNPIN